MALSLSALGATAPSARAEAPPPQRASALAASTARSPLLLRLAPAADRRERARTHAMEQRLTRLLSSLPAVERVELALELPGSAEAALDRPLPPARATVVLTSRAAPPAREEIVRVLRGTLPSFEARDLTLVQRVSTPTEPAKSALALVQIGPFRVHPESAPGLRLGIALLLGTNALLASILLWRTRPTLLAPRKVDPAARTRLPP